MSAGVANFQSLVKQAYSGELKLPAFQRTWRWRTDKVVKLFDSLRLGFPIGSFLFLSGPGTTLSPRPFNGSTEAAKDTETQFLVLDGQQRLTAGVHLFYGAGAKQYFLDLSKLEKLFEASGSDLADEEQVKKFCADLDYEDGYVLARAATSDPRALLVSKDLLCTSIVTNAAQANAALLDYIKAKPERSDLVFQLVQPHFSLASPEPVPHINIDEKASISAISRIFTTLNTTGQLLTPFELVVAILYPSKINLEVEVREFRELGLYYPNMDSTGEILLQAIAMLAGVDQKKANLPKTISADIYTQHKTAAFDALENLGEFLTNALGAGLDDSSKLVPYDAIYAPMACALRHIRERGLQGPDEAKAKKKLKLWFVAGALTQRYQEGVHNKQRKDYSDFLTWLDDDSRQPSWINEARIPSLLNKRFDGALGKLIQCFINSRDPRDPVVTEKKVGFRSGADATEKHHVFPTKYVKNLADWDAAQDKSDVLLNLMFVERSTNKSWLNANPREHIQEALKSESLEALKGYYERQFIPDAAFKILEKSEKSRDDFYQFLLLRQTTLFTWIKNQFGFSPSDVETEDDVDEEIDGDGTSGAVIVSA